jgi:hypothetical protein
MQSFVKHFINYHFARERWFYTLLIIFFVGASAFFYWFALKDTEITLDDEFTQREQVVTRAGAQSISGFVSLLGKSVSSLSEDLSEDIGEGTSSLDFHDNFTRFMNNWNGTPVAAILYADKNGKVVVDENKAITPEIGVSVADKPFFVWAKNAKAGDYNVGSPMIGTVGYSKGKYIIPVASPVITDGKFSGVVSTSVILSDLTNLFLTNLEFSNKTKILLIDQKGVILSASDASLSGTGVFDYLSKFSYSGRSDTINKIAMGFATTSNEGKMQVVLPDSTNQGKPTDYLVAFSKVNFSSSNWFLAIASPQSDSSLYLWRVKDVVYAAFAFAIFTVILFSLANLQIAKHERKRNFK